MRQYLAVGLCLAVLLTGVTYLLISMFGPVREPSAVGVTINTKGRDGRVTYGRSVGTLLRRARRNRGGPTADRNDGVLGPFQGIWDAWNEAHDEILKKPVSHFRTATEIQFDEFEQHLRDDKRQAAAQEATDVISIALNLMRWLDYKPDEIAHIARVRAERRMKGQALAILDRYQERYEI